MPRRISNTLVPRNPVAKTLATRRGGAHQQCRTGERQQHRNVLQHDLADWREELAFERQLLSDCSTNDSEPEEHDEAGSTTEPADSLYFRLGRGAISASTPF